MLWMPHHWIVQGQFGLVSEKPDLIQGVLAHNRGAGTRWSLRSHPTKAILWSLSYLLMKVFGQAICYYSLTKFFFQEHWIFMPVSYLIPWWLKESLIFSLIYFLPLAACSEIRRQQMSNIPTCLICYHERKLWLTLLSFSSWGFSWILMTTMKMNQLYDM